MAELTYQAACKALGLAPGRPITHAALQAAWRTAAKAAHPDAGGSDAAMAQINAARTTLESITINRPETEPAPTAAATPARSQPDKAYPLAITPEGHLFGPGDLYVGTCQTVAAATAFCGRAGWAYRLAKELTTAQRHQLQEASHG